MFDMKGLFICRFNKKKTYNIWCLFQYLLEILPLLLHTSRDLITSLISDSVLSAVIRCDVRKLINSHENAIGTLSVIYNVRIPTLT